MPNKTSFHETWRLLILDLWNGLRSLFQKNILIIKFFNVILAFQT